jgi:tryptophan halogenase
MLIEEGLGSPFESYATSLFCDRALVATVPQSGPIESCTTAETMNAGWCWRTPVIDEDHRGYVYASTFIDDDAAVAEMRARNPGMSDARVVHFRSGRHRDFWIGNTVALGNAYGFVEPMESTALHMGILSLAYVLEGLAARREGRGDPGFPAFANRSLGAHWDYLRWFLAVHYRYNGRLDTPFWRAARAEVDVSGAAEMLERFRVKGPWLEDQGSRFALTDPTFGYNGLMMMLLGQRAAGSEHARASMDRSAWDRMQARHRGVAARALPHREAIAALMENPDMLSGFVQSPSSWCRTEARPPAPLAAWRAAHMARA